MPPQPFWMPKQHGLHRKGERVDTMSGRRKGRKRHVRATPLGPVLAVIVTAANIQGRDGAHPAKKSGMNKHAVISTTFSDTGYTERCTQTINLPHGISVDVVRHLGIANVTRRCKPNRRDLFTRRPEANGFVMLPKQWIIEQIHAWIEKARRLVMHHDRRIDISEAWIWLAAGRQLLSR